MNLFHHVRDHLVGLLDGLVAQGALPSGLDYSRLAVEPPRDAEHGDLALNAAMVLAKQAGRKPRDLAGLLIAPLEAPDWVEKAEIAGPGFINLTLSTAFWHARLGDVLAAGTDYGNSDLGAGKKVNVEFVSANPTGPLHVGHGRGAVVGDALASLLAKAGYDVTREYYINDAGAQVEMLAQSTARRSKEALGMIELDEKDWAGLYPGEYLKPVGEKLAREYEDQVRKPDPDIQFFITHSVDEMMALIRGDLKALGISFDVFTSERALVEGGKVDDVLAYLEERGLVYTGMLEPPKGKTPDDWEARPQTLFRATAFGDDVDRPLRKADGSWTYFATDMAYHLDKYERGFADMINVWGADHGGYVKRMQAAVKALTGEKGSLDVKLCQMVNLLDGGKAVKMSKRAGTFVTLEEVIEQVGRDVVRFIMLTRKNDAQLDFDLARVSEQSRDNPVFYVQYCHARCCSVLRHAKEMFTASELLAESLAAAPLERLTDPAELALIKLMVAWPRVVESSAIAHEPHRVAYYLHDLASRFHALWTKGSKEDASLRFLSEGDRPLTLARLAMVRGLTMVIASGLGVMGVVPVEEMR